MMFALYMNHGINSYSSCLSILRIWLCPRRIRHVVLNQNKTMDSTYEEQPPLNLSTASKMIKALGNLIASIFDSRIGFDETLKVIDLQELNQKGYINLPDSDFPVNPDFEKKAREHVTGAYIRHLRGWDPIVSPIHPIFLPRKWVNVSKDDYDLMIPALRLASRLLDEPQILTYIKGALKKPLTPINDNEAANKAGQPLYSFSNEPLKDWTSEEIWHTLWTLRECITFQFSAHLPYGCMAMCGGGETGSMIAIGYVTNQ